MRSLDSQGTLYASDPAPVVDGDNTLVDDHTLA